MKKLTWLRVFLPVAATLIAAISIVTLSQSTKNQSKELSTAYLSWIGYTADDAINKATTIVHGFVEDKSETKVHEGYTSDGQLVQEFYREVTIRVVDTIKGDNDGTVTYLEMGGETDTHIYQVDGYPYIDITDEVVLLLNDKGAILHPSALLKVNGGTVTPQGRMWHEDDANNVDSSAEDSEEISLDKLYKIAGEQQKGVIANKNRGVSDITIPLDMFLEFLVEKTENFSSDF